MPLATFMPPSRLTPLAVVSGLTVLAALLRLYGLDAESLYNDEFTSHMFATRRSFPGLWGIDKHPPLHNAVLKAWIAIAGDSPWALRFPSAVFGTLAVPFVFDIGRRLGGFQVATVAALLFVFSPPNIWFAQEARMYALLVLTAAIAIWGFAVLFGPRESGGSDGAPSDNGRRAGWTALIAGTVGALYSHNTAVFLAAAQGCAGLIWIVFSPQSPAFVRRWWLAQIAILVLWCLYLPAFLAQSKSVIGHFWIPAPTLASIWRDYSSLFLDFLPAFARPWLQAGILAAAAAGCWRLSKRPLMLTAMIIFLLLIPLGELAASLVRPIFYERTLLWTTVPFVVLVALGVCSLRNRVLAAAVTAVFLAGHFVAVLDEYASPRNARWDLAAEFFAREHRDDDLIIFNPENWKKNLAYYLVKRGVKHRGLAIRFEGREIAAARELHAALESENRAWLLLRGRDSAATEDATLRHMPPGWRPVTRWTDNKRIVLRLFCRPAAKPQCASRTGDRRQPAPDPN